jgi:hypothetical protein
MNRRDNLTTKNLTTDELEALRVLLTYADHEALRIILFEHVSRDGEALRTLLEHAGREIESDLSFQFQKRPGYGEKLTVAQSAHRTLSHRLAG